MKYDVTLSGYLREKPINAIKALRLTFDWGLYDSKHTFDEIKANGKVMELTDHQATSMRSEGFIVDPVGCNTPRTREVTIFMTESAIAGRKIEAIKRLRSATQMGLKESKDIMDLMWSGKKPVALPTWYCTDKVIGKLQTLGFTVKGFTAECFQGQEDLFTI